MKKTQWSSLMVFTSPFIHKHYSDILKLKFDFKISQKFWNLKNILTGFFKQVQQMSKNGNLVIDNLWTEKKQPVL